MHTAGKETSRLRSSKSLRARKADQIDPRTSRWPSTCAISRKAIFFPKSFWSSAPISSRRFWLMPRHRCATPQPSTLPAGHPFAFLKETGLPVSAWSGGRTKRTGRAEDVSRQGHQPRGVLTDQARHLRISTWIPHSGEEAARISDWRYGPRGGALWQICRRALRPRGRARFRKLRPPETRRNGPGVLAKTELPRATSRWVCLRFSGNSSSSHEGESDSSPTLKRVRRNRYKDL